MKALVKKFLKGVPLEYIAQALTELVLESKPPTGKVKDALKGLATAILEKTAN